MKKLVFIIVVLFASCSEEEIKIPDDVIGKNEMTSILTDISLAQASYSIRIKSDSVKSRMTDYVNQVLLLHSTEKEKFLKSLKFYGENPEILKEVYDSVITNLSKMQGETELN